MLWTVMLLCDGPADSEFQVTWARGHFIALDARAAAHDAYRELVGDLEGVIVLDVIVLPGRVENALGSHASLVRMELNS